MRARHLSRTPRWGGCERKSLCFCALLFSEEFGHGRHWLYENHGNGMHAVYDDEDEALVELFILKLRYEWK